MSWSFSWEISNMTHNLTKRGFDIAPFWGINPKMYTRTKHWVVPSIKYAQIYTSHSFSFLKTHSSEFVFRFLWPKLRCYNLHLTQHAMVMFSSKCIFCMCWTYICIFRTNILAYFPFLAENVMCLYKLQGHERYHYSWVGIKLRGAKSFARSWM